MKTKAEKIAMGMFQDVYKVVMSIEKGKVASYGVVARLAGYPRGARQVGWALHQNPDNSVVPCHRVVKQDGSLSESFAFGGIIMHEKLLANEGVKVVNGKVDMSIYAIDYKRNN